MSNNYCTLQPLGQLDVQMGLLCMVSITINAIAKGNNPKHILLECKLIFTNKRKLGGDSVLYFENTGGLISFPKNETRSPNFNFYLLLQIIIINK